jgi:hypothetical protein
MRSEQVFSDVEDHRIKVLRKQLDAAAAARKKKPVRRRKRRSWWQLFTAKRS